jgi:GT2 family glycosyltransferase
MMMEVQVKQRILVVAYSIIIVTHGREELLMKCLESLTGEVEEWQLILVANGETLSDEILQKAAELTPSFTLVSAPEVLTPGKARNMGLEKVEAEWIYFLDDDAYVLPGYWDLARVCRSEPKIEVFGGPDSPAKGMNVLATSLSLALSSPFCSGTTFGRHKSKGKKLQYADEEILTSCNLWVKKQSLDGITFPENFNRAEEIVFLQKLKKEGKGLYYHPKLKVAHHRRSRLKELWRPTFFAGYFRSRLMKEKLSKGNTEFWLPAFFVLLHLLVFLDPLAFWYLVRMYVSIILFVSIGIAMQVKRFWLFPVIAFMHYYIVFVYGVGFLSERLGIVRK